LQNNENPPAPPPSTASSAPPPKRPPLSRRWSYIIIGVTLFFILLPFLFWRATWFGVPLSNSELAADLEPSASPHNIQHALSQVADRIVRNDASVKSFYPQVVALSKDPHSAIRTMDAWVMGQDNQSPQFHAALLPLLHDSDTSVRRNAALALVRFRDTSGHQIIVDMLKPAPVPSPVSGILRAHINSGDSVSTGTLLARIETPHGRVDIRSDFPGTLNRWLVRDHAAVTAGQTIATILPSDDEVWEGLRALFLIGTPADLSVIAPYARGDAGAAPQIAEQARLTMREIQARASALPASSRAPASLSDSSP